MQQEQLNKPRCRIVSEQENNNMIIDFLKKCKDNKNWTKQGSDEWKKSRSNYCGGSEISSFTGNSIFKSPFKYLKSKLFISEFKGNLACAWGNCIEPLSEQLIEDLFYTKIRGSDSWVCSEQLDYISYSPDGLCTVDLAEYTLSTGETFIAPHHNELCIDNIYNKDIIFVRGICNVPVLIELKNLHKRIIGTKPDRSHVDQVLAGLDIMPFLDFGILVYSLFRICTEEQYDFVPGYCILYHDKDTQTTLEKIIPIGLATIYIYAKKESVDKYISMDANELINEFPKYNKDLMFVNGKILWTKRDKGKVDPKDEKTDIPEGFVLIMPLRLKLLRITVNQIPRDTTFVNKVYPDIKQCMDFVTKTKDKYKKIYDNTKDLCINDNQIKRVINDEISIFCEQNDFDIKK